VKYKIKPDSMQLDDDAKLSKLAEFTNEMPITAAQKAAGLQKKMNKLK
jgi:hypothetical protein